jgi:hypothetical protein
LSRDDSCRRGLESPLLSLPSAAAACLSFGPLATWQWGLPSFTPKALQRALGAPPGMTSASAPQVPARSPSQSLPAQASTPCLG